LSSVDIETLRTWIGRQEVREDVITAAPAAGLSAALDYAGPLAVPGDPLPPAWHWLYFLPTVAASEIGSDGHPRRGGFLPPVPLPRRMWAGSDIRFCSDLRIGDPVRRVSTVADVQHKHGDSGELVFVKVRHDIYSAETPAIVEDQNLVYRAAASGSTVASRGAPAAPAWSREIRPDPVLLFRFSALTFNAHRIHYDRDYARDREGYPSLVVQGPLTAILLLDLLRRELPEARLAGFRFRGLRPLFDLHPLCLQGRLDGDGAHLWALDNDGALAMDARATLV
jgi:3-methylfumaryl-CoA hydratase